MVNVGTKFVFSSHKDSKNDPAPSQKIICPKSGVNKTLESLTDADIIKMINKGNKNFKDRPVADLSPKKSK